MMNRDKSLLLSICAAALYFLGTSAEGQVVAKTSAGEGTITGVSSMGGTLYPIPESAGKIFGSGSSLVLVHSFSGFSLGTKDEAEFANTLNGSGLPNGSADMNVATIIARVSGGTASSISGKIESATYFPNASLFLINPSGVMFNSGASVSVGHDFVASTANYVVLQDGSVFYADPTQSGQADPGLTSISTADVAAFGFLKGTTPGTTGTIAVDAALSSSTGNLEFVGGNFSETGTASATLPGSILSVFSGGTVKANHDATVPYLTSTGTTSYAAVTTTYGGKSFGNTGDFTSLGSVTVQGGAGSIAASGANSHVVIRGGSLVDEMSTASTPAASSITATQGADINIDVDDALSITDGSSISTSANTGGTTAGPVNVTAGSVSLNYGTISSSGTNGASTGTVTVATTETDSEVGVGATSFTINGSSGTSSIYTTAATGGTDGAVNVTSAGSLTLSTGGTIATQTQAIDVDVAAALSLTGTMANNTSISSTTGSITLGSATLTSFSLGDKYSSVSTSAGVNGGAGGVTLNSAGSATVMNSGTIAAGSGGVSIPNAGALTLTGAKGSITANGGDIDLGSATTTATTSPLASLTLNSGASITETAATGAINIFSSGAVILGNTGTGSITSGGGDIKLGTSGAPIDGLTVNANSTITQNGSGAVAINSNAAVSVSGSITSSGTISIDSAPSVTVSGSISAAGGNITLGGIGTLTVNNTGTIKETAGATSQSLTINAAGAINNQGTISTVTSNTTAADGVSITGSSLTLDGGVISSQATTTASNNGAAGVIGVMTTGTIALSHSGKIESESDGAVASETTTGTGGTVTVTAGTSLSLDTGAMILSEAGGLQPGAQGVQNGAELNVTASNGSLSLSNTSFIETLTTKVGNGGGNGGNVFVTDKTGAISVASHSQIVSMTTGGSSAGNVTVNDNYTTYNTANTLTITGTGASLDTGIFSLSMATGNDTGNAGSVSVNSGGDMQLSGGGQIASVSGANGGDAGSVTVFVNSGNLNIGGTGPIIYSEALNSASAGGGVTVDALTNLQASSASAGAIAAATVTIGPNAEIATFSNDQPANADGTTQTDITVNAQNLTLQGGSIQSTLVSDADGLGATGGITVNVQNALTLNNDIGTGAVPSIQIVASTGTTTLNGVDPLAGMVTIQTSSLSVANATIVLTGDTFSGYGPDIQAANNLVVSPGDTQVTTFSGKSVLSLPPAGMGIVLAATGAGQLTGAPAGAINPTQVHNGYVYTIDDGDGILVGNEDQNLFLSFSTFNLGLSSDGTSHINETANFEVGTGVSNIVARIVGGGTAAQLNGRIEVTGNPSANLFFVDPTGITVGSRGYFNGKGALTLASANSLTLSGTGVFNASPTDMSLSTSDPDFLGSVADYGFSSTPGEIMFTSVGNFLLTNQLQLIGGTIELDNSKIFTQSSQIFLFSAGTPSGQGTPASLSFDSSGGDSTTGVLLGTQTGGKLDTSFTAAGTLGSVTLDNSVLAATSANTGKPSTIYIRGNTYTQESSLIVDESLAGSGSTSGSVVINMDGPATIDLDPSAAMTASYILASTLATANGGTVEVDASDLTITGPAVNAANNPVGILSQAEPVNFFDPKSNSYKAFTGTPGTGSGGQINLFLTGGLTMSGYGLISANTYGAGNGGNMSINAGGTVMISGGSEISDGSIRASGQGGNLIATIGGDLTINADGAPIFINDSNGLEYQPTGISAASFDAVNPNGAFSTPVSPQTQVATNYAQAGSLTVNVTGTVTIEGGGEISSGTIDGGNGGTLMVTAGALLINGANTPYDSNTTTLLYPTGIISSSFEGGDAGQVTVTANGPVSILNGGEISSETYFTYTYPIFKNYQGLNAFGAGNGAPGGVGQSVTLNINAPASTLPASGLPNAGDALYIDGSNVQIDQTNPDSSTYPNSAEFVTGVLSSTVDGVQAGALTVNVMQAGSVNIRGGGELSAQTNGVGTGGAVNLTINNGSLTINGSSSGSGPLPTTVDPLYNAQYYAFYILPVNLQTGVFSSTAGASGAGTLSVTTSGDVNISEGGQISSGTTDSGIGSLVPGGVLGSGPGGTLTFSSGSLTIDGTGAAANSTGIFSITNVLPLVQNATTGTSSEQGNGGQMNLSVTGAVNISGGGEIAATSSSGGSGGDITLNLAGTLSVTSGGQITVSSTGAGAGGSIAIGPTSTNPTFSAPTSITIDGAGTTNETGLLAEESGAGNSDAYNMNVANMNTAAAAIAITAGTLTVQNGGEISSATTNTGNSGPITITTTALGTAASPGLLVTGRSSVTHAGSQITSATFYTTGTNTQGLGGNVTLMVNGQATISNGGVVTAGTTGSGDGGSVTMYVTGDLALASGGQISAGTYETPFMGGTFGNGGDIVVGATGALSVTGGAQISASSSNSGAGGSIQIGPTSTNMTPSAPTSITLDGTGSANQTGVFAQETGSGNSDAFNINAGHMNTAESAIAITSGLLTLENGGEISSATTNTGNAGPITITTTTLGTSAVPGLLVTGTGSLSHTASQITSATSGTTGDATQGQGGDVTLTVNGEATISQGGQLTAGTSGSGNGGSVTLNVTGDVAVTTGGQITASSSNTSIGLSGEIVINQMGSQYLMTSGQNPGGIWVDGATSTISTAAGASGGTRLDPSNTHGNITLNAESVTVDDNAIISSNTTGAYDAGDITINGQSAVVPAQSVIVENGGQISSNSSGASAVSAGSVSIASGLVMVTGAGSAISTNANTTGTIAPSSDGQIVLNSSDLVITNQGIVSSTTSGPADGGTITILDPDLITMNHHGTIDASSSSAAQGGNGGSIDINCTTAADGSIIGGDMYQGSISLLDNSTVTAGSLNTTGGMIDIYASYIDIEHYSSVETKGDGASNNGGSIAIYAGNTFYLNDHSDISTHSGGRGGNITVDPVFDILNHSFIDAFGTSGDGKVLIESSFLLVGNSTITATGGVTIDSLPLDLTGSLVGLPADLTDEAKRLRESCARAANHEFSSLIVVGRGGTETAPDELNSDTGASDAGSAPAAHPHEKLR